MKEFKRGYVYKITNIQNDKIYIGITQLTINDRWKSHINTAFSMNSKDYNALFKKAIRKYGVDSFRIEEIECITTSLEDLKQREIYWIQYYHSYAFDKDGWGYNSTRGGDYPYGLFLKPVVQCDIVSGMILNKYDSINEASREIGCRIENIGEFNHSSGGFCFFYIEDIEKLSEEEIINKVHSLYPTLVYQADIDGNILNIYKDVPSAAKENNYSSVGNIISCCLGNRRLAGGYQWFYQRDFENRAYKKIRDIEKYIVGVTSYGFDGKPRKIYSSVIEAADDTGALDSHISSCCKGKRQIAGNRQWRLTSDNIKQLPELFTKRPIQCIETSQIFETANHAAKYFNYSQQTIKNSCMGKKTTKPYHFIWYDYE